VKGKAGVGKNGDADMGDGGHRRAVGTEEDVGMGAGATPRRRMLARELKSAK
jgi:hypothetical protein